MGEQRYCVDYARLGTAGCKKCKVKIEKGSLRIAKVVSNPFSEEGGDMKQWYHVACIFETFKRARATTKKIEDPTDLEGWDVVKQEDRGSILKLIDEFQSNAAAKAAGGPKAAKQPKQTAKAGKQTVLKNVVKSPTKPAAATNTPAPTNDSIDDVRSSTTSDPNHRDNSFREFRRLCANIAEESGYIAKTNVVSNFLSNGTGGSGFEGDLYLWLKMLLPGIVKRVYNVQSKQLVKLFSAIFGTNQDEMITDLEQGDVAETVKTFFEQSQICPPAKKSNLTLFDVDEYLDELSKETKEDDQVRVLKKITKRCTSNDLKMVVRLIKHDLRINAGAKHILEAVHPDAYQAFQASRNLKDVVDRIQDQRDAAAASGKPGLTKTLSIRATLMTPILPMLAEPCKSVEYAMKKCPNGMYAEIKYDGERVQLHKQGNNFSYFSRSLKPVLPHKVQHFKDYIPKAFPHGNDVILDSEVLLIDTNTGNPLPFGTLGVHKKAAFKDANVCLFVFDCIHYNGESFIDKPLKERRRMLEKNMVEIPNRIMFSEMQHITQPTDLQSMIMKVLRQGLEGLVLKDVRSPYEPGKRHWLKVKKDYLAQGAMADSADLVVLGAFYGTGNKGGMMSIFLMGCYDPMLAKWCTVTKVSGGHDDQTLDRLQKELVMDKISKDPSKVPNWLNVNKNLIPDFVCKDPKKSQVWEIVGAEFTKAEIHTAAGISIRFPRVTRIRYDKTWETATSLPELKELLKKSKESSDLPDLLGDNTISPVKSQSNGSKLNSDSDDEDGALSSSRSSVQKTPKKNNSRNSSRTSTPGSSTRKRPATADASSDEASPAKKAKQLDISSFFTSSKVKLQSQSVSTNQSPPPQKTPDPDTVSSIQLSKPVCRYGSSCYQKNPDHLKKFDHSMPSALSSSSAPTTNPLPDFFRGVRAFLPKEVDKVDVLRRFIIAYDGDVVEEFELSTATHAVVTNSSLKTKLSPPSSCVKVSVEWLWDCIKLQRLVPCRPYAPSC